jgi:phospholipid/cholesterol/gamma-HCH transport system substrate-binding protein
LGHGHEQENTTVSAKREQALVGLFVLIVATVLVFVVSSISGVFGRNIKTYRASVRFAGGLENGAGVRYAGGPKVGKIEKMQLDPNNPAQIEIIFSVRSDIPVKTDSKLKIMSLSPLGENHLEIAAGSPQAPPAPNGAELRAEPYVDFNAITARLDALGPKIEELVTTLNARAVELKETVARINDLMSAQNRSNVSASLGHVRGMLAEDRPKLKSTLEHMDTASAKISPLLDDFKKTIAQAQQALEHVDAMVGENRADVRQAVGDLRQALTSARSLTGQLDRTLEVNAENIDELLENMRHTTQNLKEFTDIIKSRPSTLIRSSSRKDRKQ